MMREVVEAKPGSAKAHYVLAEILARQRKFTDAAEQARLVRLNDPISRPWTAPSSPSLSACWTVPKAAPRPPRRPNFRRPPPPRHHQGASTGSLQP